MRASLGRHEASGAARARASAGRSADAAVRASRAAGRRSGAAVRAPDARVGTLPRAVRYWPRRTAPQRDRRAPRARRAPAWRERRPRPTAGPRASPRPRGDLSPPPGSPSRRPRRTSRRPAPGPAPAWKSCARRPRRQVRAAAAAAAPPERHASYVSRPSDSELPEDRHPGPGGQRLAGEQQPRVDQFGDRVHPDHARPAAAAPTPSRAAAAWPVPRAPAGRAACRAPWTTTSGLGGRRAPREAGELARVADGFEVHEGDVGVRVVVPVLEYVVAGHVRRGCRTRRRSTPR